MDGHRIRVSTQIKSEQGNSPAAPAGIRFCNLSITSSVLNQQATSAPNKDKHDNYGENSYKDHKDDDLKIVMFLIVQLI